MIRVGRTDVQVMGQLINRRMGASGRSVLELYKDRESRRWRYFVLDAQGRIMWDSGWEKSVERLKERLEVYAKVNARRL